MTWEIATATVYTGLSITSIALAIALDRIKLIETKGGQTIDLNIRYIFLALSILFMQQALNTNMLVIEANSNSIANQTIVNGLVGNASVGFTIMLVVFWIFVLVAFLDLLFAIVNAFYLRKKTPVRPRSI